MLLVSKSFFLVGRNFIQVLLSNSPNDKCHTIAIEVVLEEQSSQGTTDSPPMTLFDLIIKLEKAGHLDTTSCGHQISRPPTVARGEETDRPGIRKSVQLLEKPTAHRSGLYCGWPMVAIGGHV